MPSGPRPGLTSDLCQHAPISQSKGAAEQHYQLKKQYETGLEEHRKKLSATIKELSARYGATVVCRVFRAVPDGSNWSAYPNIWIDDVNFAGIQCGISKPGKMPFSGGQKVWLML